MKTPKFKVTDKMKKQDPMLSREIDVRPLLQRLGKRIKPNQQPDAHEQLFFSPYTVYCGAPKDDR